ncbi:MAG: glycosyltransferase [Nitrospirota bacterium]|nr:glycosyltransferase [Nitrospirota bacterium]
MSEPGNRIFNILHVVSRLPVGGVENMLLKVVRGYDKKRFNVSVCCIKEGGDIADELIRSGHKVDVLNKMKRRGFDWSAVYALYKLLKRDNIHVLRTHQYHANLYGRLAGILAGVPVMVPSFHSSYKSPDEPKIHRRCLNRLLAFFSDKLVAVSNTVASDIMRYDGVSSEKIKVNYNGIVMDKFNQDMPKQEAGRRMNIPVHSLIVGTTGRLKEEKGHKILLSAVSGLKDISIAIAGDGPLRAELRGLADRLQVDCTFTGQLSPEKIPLFLNSLDIFCFPSLWEGFPTALIEAMAAGLPVVASDIPSNREVLADTGIFVPRGDEEALAKTIKMLIDDPSLRNELGGKARERSKSFSIGNTVKTYEDLFGDILKKKRLM